MLPLSNSFKIFLSNFILSVSVFGAIIIHFFRYVPFLYRSLFNSQSNPRIDFDHGTTPMAVDSVFASNSSKFQSEPTSQIHGFVEESETASFLVEELYCDSSPSSGNQIPNDFEFSCGKNLWVSGLGRGEGFALVICDEQKKGFEICEDETVSKVLTISEDNSVLASNSSKFQSKPTKQIHGFLEESETASLFVEELNCDSSPSSGNQILDDFELSREKKLWESGLETSEDFVDEFSDKQNKDSESCENVTVSEILTIVGDCSVSLSDSELESLSSDEEEFIEIEPQFEVSNAKVFPQPDFVESKETEMGFEEEEEEEEFMEEHEDLINQLKMELRNSRTGGLPTVLEEEGEPELSICPTSVESLKNGGSFEYKEHFKEIHKVYKGYADKMRKLDVFNTQTNYAIGFVKLKDPTSSIGGRKSGIKSMVSHKLRSLKAEKDCPKLIRDLKRDLEMVYVGHLCLSWEVLHWQHRKAIQLQQNASRRTPPYSRVVSEFQLFCILIQRFIEDERFCGPRIENYVKNRLLVRSLLQVPAIREDCANDKKLRSKEGESIISTAALVSIIEEAMHVFREFLRTDKDVGNSDIKRVQVQFHHTDIENPFDTQLIMLETRTELRKKEKRLKEIMRSGNCIVKKLQRISEEGRVKNELLIAEVELRLISRVMSMSRLTESQLIWCHKKLNQVNFVDRKVFVEPSFLLFPC